jgi:GntR family transcriptional regulator
VVRIQITTGGKVPIYRQVVDQIRSAIAGGALAVGDPLPSVRALATELVVNPNTIAKSYSMLVADGVVESQQGRGFFVTQRREIFTKRERSRRLDQAIAPLVAEAVTLGFDEAEVIAEVTKQFAKMLRK